MALYGRSYVKQHIQRPPVTPPVAQPPVSSNFIKFAHATKVPPTHPKIIPVHAPAAVGPAPVARPTFVRASTPRVTTPRPHISRVVIFPTAPPPIGMNMIVRGKQPSIRRGYIHTIPAPAPIIILPPQSRNFFKLAGPPPRPTPIPHIQRFNRYVPAIPPIAIRLLKFARNRPAPTHILVNTLSLSTLPPPPFLGVYEVGGNMMANRLMRGMGFPG